MGQEISIFPRYSQKENRITNYCLLTLKLIYEDSPAQFAAVLESIFGDNAPIVGVRFEQQKSLSDSTIDGMITQKAFTILIETKKYDWFSTDQIIRHLGGLKKDTDECQIVIALSNFEKENEFEEVNAAIQNDYNDSIVFKALSFEDFLTAIRDIQSNVSRPVQNTIEELEAYLDRESLLPRWKHRLDIVNSAKSQDIIREKRAYICPTEGRQYSHKRCKYFGMYANKKVSLIAEIQAVVDIDPTKPDEAEIQWNNSSEKDDELIKEAKEKVLDIDWGPARVFLLGEPQETNFIKDSKGGMMGSKKYMDISHLEASNAEDLAKNLNNQTWSEVESGR